jgi:hypothetical protein
MLELKTINDGKEKWQSWEAHISNTKENKPLDEIDVWGICYGSNEKEAKHNLKVEVLKLITELYKAVEELEK